MRRYLFKFFWNTDIRVEKCVEAKNEVSALCKALEDIDDPNGWITKPQFKITIEQPPK